MKLISIALLSVAVSGCTESERAGIGATRSDRPADVTCRSYGSITFEGRSTGKVVYDEGGRVTFVDAANLRLTTVEGECVIVYARDGASPVEPGAPAAP